jgi:hypothetical protein
VQTLCQVEKTQQNQRLFGEIPFLSWDFRSGPASKRRFCRQTATDFLKITKNINKNNGLGLSLISDSTVSIA